MQPPRGDLDQEAAVVHERCLELERGVRRVKARKLDRRAGGGLIQLPLMRPQVQANLRRDLDTLAPVCF